MKCKKCGYDKLKKENKTCPKCGYDFSDDKSTISKIAEGVLGAEIALTTAGVGAATLGADDTTSEEIKQASESSITTNNKTLDDIQNNTNNNNTNNNFSSKSNSDGLGSKMHNDSLSIDSKANTTSSTKNITNQSSNTDSVSAQNIDANFDKESDDFLKKINELLASSDNEENNVNDNNISTNNIDENNTVIDEDAIRKELLNNVDKLSKDNFDLSEFTLKKKCLKCGTTVESGSLICNSCSENLEEEFEDVFVDKEGNEYSGLEELIEKYPNLLEILALEDFDENDEDFDFTTASDEEKIDEAQKNANMGGGSEFYIDNNSLCYAINTIRGAKNGGGSIVAGGWSVVSAAVNAISSAGITRANVSSIGSLYKIKTTLGNIFGGEAGGGFLEGLETKLKELDNRMKDESPEYKALWNKVNSEYMANFNEYLDDETITAAGYTGMSLEDAWKETFSFRDKAIKDIEDYKETGQKFSDKSQEAVDEYITEKVDAKLFESLYRNSLTKAFNNENRSESEEEFVTNWINEYRNASETAKAYCDVGANDTDVFAYQFIAAYDYEKLVSSYNNMETAQQELATAQEAYDKIIQDTSEPDYDNVEETEEYNKKLKPYEDALKAAEDKCTEAIKQNLILSETYKSTSDTLDASKNTYFSGLITEEGFQALMDKNKIKIDENTVYTPEQLEEIAAQQKEIDKKLEQQRIEMEKFVEEYNNKINSEDLKVVDENIEDIYSRLQDSMDYDEVSGLLSDLSMQQQTRNSLVNAITLGNAEDFDRNKDSKISSAEVKYIEVETVEPNSGAPMTETQTIIVYKDKNGNEIENITTSEAALYFAKMDDIPNNYKSAMTIELKDQVESLSYLSDIQIDVLNYQNNTSKYYNTDFQSVYKESIKTANIIAGEQLFNNYQNDMENIDNWFEQDAGWCANALEDVAGWGYTAIVGGGDGIQNFFAGFHNLVSPDGIPSALEYKQMLIGSYLTQVYDLSFMSGTYEISTSIGNMLPSVAVSCIPVVGAYLGTALMGISAAGNTTEQGLQLGYTKEQAYLYGSISGLSEAVLGYFLGGITKLAKGSAGFITRLLSKTVKETAVKATEQVAAKTLSAAVQAYVTNMISEGFEEGVQELLDPLLKNAIAGGEYNPDTGKYENVSVDINAVLKSAYYGAITAGIMESFGLMKQVKSFNQTGSTAGIAAVRSALINQNPNMNMFEIARETRAQINAMRANNFNIGNVIETIQSNPSIQHAYDEYAANTPSKSRMEYSDFILQAAANAALSVNNDSIGGEISDAKIEQYTLQQAAIAESIENCNKQLSDIEDTLQSTSSTVEEKVNAKLEQTRVTNQLLELLKANETVTSALASGTYDITTAMENLTEMYAKSLTEHVKSLNGVIMSDEDIDSYSYGECLAEQTRLTEQIKVNDAAIEQLHAAVETNAVTDEILFNTIEKNNVLKQQLEAINSKINSFEDSITNYKGELESQNSNLEGENKKNQSELERLNKQLEIKKAQLRNQEKSGITEKQKGIRTEEINKIKNQIKALNKKIASNNSIIENNTNVLAKLNDSNFASSIMESIKIEEALSFNLAEVDFKLMNNEIFKKVLANITEEQFIELKTEITNKLNSMSTDEIINTLKGITNGTTLLNILNNSTASYMTKLNLLAEDSVIGKSIIIFKDACNKIKNINESINEFSFNASMDVFFKVQNINTKINEIKTKIGNIDNLPAYLKNTIADNLTALKNSFIEKFGNMKEKLGSAYDNVVFSIETLLININQSVPEAYQNLVDSFNNSVVSKVNQIISNIESNVDITTDTKVDAKTDTRVDTKTDTNTNTTTIRESTNNRLSKIKADINEKLTTIANEILSSLLYPDIVSTGKVTFNERMSEFKSKVNEYIKNLTEKMILPEVESVVKEDSSKQITKETIREIINKNIEGLKQGFFKSITEMGLPSITEMEAPSLKEETRSAANDSSKSIVNKEAQVNLENKKMLIQYLGGAIAPILIGNAGSVQTVINGIQSYIGKLEQKLTGMKSENETIDTNIEETTDIQKFDTVEKVEEEIQNKKQLLKSLTESLSQYDMQPNSPLQKFMDSLKTDIAALETSKVEVSPTGDVATENLGVKLANMSTTEVISYVNGLSSVEALDFVRTLATEGSINLSDCINEIGKIILEKVNIDSAATFKTICNVFGSSIFTSLSSTQLSNIILNSSTEIVKSIMEVVPLENIIKILDNYELNENVVAPIKKIIENLSVQNVAECLKNSSVYVINNVLQFSSQSNLTLAFESLSESEMSNVLNATLERVVIINNLVPILNTIIANLDVNNETVYNKLTKLFGKTLFEDVTNNSILTLLNGCNSTYFKTVLDSIKMDKLYSIIDNNIGNSASASIIGKILEGVSPYYFQQLLLSNSSYVINLASIEALNNAFNFQIMSLLGFANLFSNANLTPELIEKLGKCDAIKKLFINESFFNAFVEGVKSGKNYMEITQQYLFDNYNIKFSKKTNKFSNVKREINYFEFENNGFTITSSDDSNLLFNIDEIVQQFNLLNQLKNTNFSPAEIFNICMYLNTGDTVFLKGAAPIIIENIEIINNIDTNNIIKIFPDIITTTGDIQNLNPSKISKYFKNFRHGEFGCDQGCTSSLASYDLYGFTYTAKGLAYTGKSEYVTINNAAQLEVIRKHFAEKGINIRYNIKYSERFYVLRDHLISSGLTSTAAEAIILNLDNEGACTYASMVNAIFATFMDDPVSFKFHFGFDMYKVENGINVPNYDMLLVDLYANINKTSNGGKLLEAVTSFDGTVVYDINRSELNSDGNIDAKNQQYIQTNKSGSQAIKNYLKSKGIEINIVPYGESYSHINSAKMERFKEFIAEKLSQGSKIRFSWTTEYTNAIMISSTKIYNSKVNYSGHSMFLADITEAGIIVSSWGREFLIRFGDLTNMEFEIECNDIVETTHPSQEFIDSNPAPDINTDSEITEEITQPVYAMASPSSNFVEINDESFVPAKLTPESESILTEAVKKIDSLSSKGDGYRCLTATVEEGDYTYLTRELNVREIVKSVPLGEVVAFLNKNGISFDSKTDDATASTSDVSFGDAFESNTNIESVEVDDYTVGTNSDGSVTFSRIMENGEIVRYSSSEFASILLKMDVNHQNKFLEALTETQKSEVLLKVNEIVQAVTNKLIEIASNSSSKSLSDVNINEINETMSLLSNEAKAIAEKVIKAKELQTKLLDTRSKLSISIKKSEINDMFSLMSESEQIEVIDNVVKRMLDGETLSRQTYKAIFEANIFNVNSVFSQNYLHHIIEDGIKIGDTEIKGNKKLADTVKAVYENARKSTTKIKDMGQLHSYCDHTESHVLQVAFLTIASYGKIVKAAKFKNPGLNVDVKANINEMFYAGIFHDLGMAVGECDINGNPLNPGVALAVEIAAAETAIVRGNIINILTNKMAGTVRENHSLNSALAVLVNRAEIESMGLDADRIALICFSHSKSNSGVGNLIESTDWSFAIQKITEAKKAINKYKKSIGDTNLITFDTSKFGRLTGEKVKTSSPQKTIGGKTKLFVDEFEFKPGVIDTLSLEGLALRIGDAYVSKAQITISEPVKWYGIDPKTGARKIYSATKFVLTQTGAYMAYDSTVTQTYDESSGVTNSEDVETSDKYGYAYFTLVDGKMVPWKTTKTTDFYKKSDGITPILDKKGNKIFVQSPGINTNAVLDSAGIYAGIEDSLMFSERVELKATISGVKVKLYATDKGYWYTERTVTGVDGKDVVVAKTYYLKLLEGDLQEIETIDVANDTGIYGKDILTSAGKFLVGENNTSYWLELTSDNILLSTFEIGDIGIFPYNTISKGIEERVGEIATAPNVDRKVNIKIDDTQFSQHFTLGLDGKYHPKNGSSIASTYIKYITAIATQKGNTTIKFAINGIDINLFSELSEALDIEYDISSASSTFVEIVDESIIPTKLTSESDIIFTEVISKTDDATVSTSDVSLGDALESNTNIESVEVDDYTVSTNSDGSVTFVRIMENKEIERYSSSEFASIVLEMDAFEININKLLSKIYGVKVEISSSFAKLIKSQSTGKYNSKLIFDSITKLTYEQLVTYDELIKYVYSNFNVKCSDIRNLSKTYTDFIEKNLPDIYDIILQINNIKGTKNVKLTENFIEDLIKILPKLMNNNSSVEVMKENLSSILISELLFDKPIFTREELKDLVEKKIFKDLFTQLYTEITTNNSTSDEKVIKEELFKKFFNDNLELTPKMAIELNGQLNMYETILLYNYLENLIKEKSNKITNAFEKAKYDYSARNTLRVLSQRFMKNSGSLPKEGTNAWNKSFESALVSKILIECGIIGCSEISPILKDLRIEIPVSSSVMTRESIKSLLDSAVDSNNNIEFESGKTMEKVLNELLSIASTSIVDRACSSISSSAYNSNSIVNKIFGIAYTEIESYIRKYKCSPEIARIIYDEKMNNIKFPGIAEVLSKIKSIIKETQIFSKQIGKDSEGSIEEAHNRRYEQIAAYILSEKSKGAKIIQLEQCFSQLAYVEDLIENTKLRMKIIETACFEKLGKTATTSDIITEAMTDNDYQALSKEIKYYDYLKKHVEELITEEEIRITEKELQSLSIDDINRSKLQSKLDSLRIKYKSELSQRIAVTDTYIHDYESTKSILELESERTALISEKSDAQSIIENEESKSIADKNYQKLNDARIKFDKKNLEIKKLNEKIRIKKIISAFDIAVNNNESSYRKQLEMLLSTSPNLDIDMILLLRKTAYREMLLETFERQGDGILGDDVTLSIKSIVSKMDEFSIFNREFMEIKNFWQIKGVKKDFRPKSQYSIADYTSGKIDWSREAYFCRYTPAGLTKMMNELMEVIADKKVVRIVSEYTYEKYIKGQIASKKEGRRHWITGYTVTETFATKQFTRTFADIADMSRTLATSISENPYLAIFDISDETAIIGFASGNEVGANILWIPGGLTLSEDSSVPGVLDLVLTNIPLNSENYKKYEFRS